ncbi:XRE family transcriptional regulator [Pedobacter sp. LMG 31464]|uniref:XRE family transcriptional regulator n=1 Tax=Pedobacter planticolens TaxID=2679964 RepID=A0A923IVD6_9SPHI|nr:helix-turn-helix transcriptional regulator [Pedobacter planticolens]MBB2143937.1 XRE family transcriptional regulator [Pedobacter planticolens]
MANKSDEILHREISEIDYLLVLHITELRIKKGLTQLQLSQKMKLADGFVSKVETLTERAKYNIRHLPLLAKALGVEIENLIPQKSPIYDLVILTLKKTNKINNDGSISTKKVIEVISIEPISKNED